MKKARESLASALDRLSEMISAPALRAASAISDVGEIMHVVIGDDTANAHEVHSKKRDVWTMFTDVLSGMKQKGRLYAPAGILWRFTKVGDGGHAVRGRKMNGPGGWLVIPDGGDGATDNVVPGWDDSTNLDKDNAGILLGEGFHLESKNDRVRIVSNSSGANSGKKSTIEMKQDGTVTATSCVGDSKQSAFTLKPDGSGSIAFGSGATLTIRADGSADFSTATGKDLTFNGGGAKVARVGDAIAGHVHVEAGNAGPYPIVGSTQLATDTINAGAPFVKA